MRAVWFLVLTQIPLVAAAQVQVSPAAVALRSPEASQQILVSVPDGNRRRDVTRQVQYQSRHPAIATVDAQGLIVAVADGTAEVVVTHDGQTAVVPVVVTGVAKPIPVSFDQQILPILTKSGCNAGGCHGKAEGQNGFKLSVFGYDPPADVEALTKMGRGRRVFPPAPERSLLLTKALATVPHGGGRKIDHGSLRHKLVHRWIAEGTPATSDEISPTVSIEVEPTAQVLLARGTQQLRVTAIDAKGERRCITTEAEYQSNAETIAGVDARGLVTCSEISGEAAILVRYLGHVAVARITQPKPGVQFTRPAEANFVDRHVWNKLAHLGLPPSPAASDAMFLRRVSLDTIGTLPTAAESRAFLADTNPEKRKLLIDKLLARPEYADYWTMRWADILRVDRDNITPAGAVAMTRWLHTQFTTNRPYDQMVREVLTAQGDVTSDGPTAFYKVLKTPEELSRSVSQLFLGVRIECAQCHHHPFERWGQDDYFAFAGFFTGVARKNLPTGAEAIFSRGGTDLKHPRTGEVAAARGLGAATADFTGINDRRQVLADWVTSDQNPFFAKAIANRLWAHYFGRGLVEPLDDLRATNPATNEPLLDALAAHLKEVRYDLKAFTKTLLNSHAYQLSCDPLPENADDEQNFSHALHKVLPAEVLLDAINQTTGVTEKFETWPEGYRAIQVWDNRMPSYFFRIFGRPVRASVCECERSSEPSISQALHLMNSPEITDKIRERRGHVRQLAAGTTPPEAVYDELFLSALSRYPTPEEKTLLAEAWTALEGDRAKVFEDVLWALLNSKEFVYNH